MTPTPAPTLVRTRRRPRRLDDAQAAAAVVVAGQVAAGLAANDPPMLAVSDNGRGWWPVDSTGEGVTVRRHGEVLTVPWAQVALDA